MQRRGALLTALIAQPSRPNEGLQLRELCAVNIDSLTTWLRLPKLSKRQTLTCLLATSHTKLRGEIPTHVNT